MNDKKRNQQIETLALQIIQDKTSLDEKEPEKLQKYYDYITKNFMMNGIVAEELLNETFLYLKLKDVKDIDPLQEGDKFGAGFS